MSTQTTTTQAASGAEGLTPEQRELARHALGLPNRKNRSYRNRFVTGAGAKVHAHWMAMVDAGFARRRDGKTLPFGGDDMFSLTLAGAKAAKRRNEGLDPEDFPALTTGAAR